MIERRLQTVDDRLRGLDGDRLDREHLRAQLEAENAALEAKEQAAGR